MAVISWIIAGILVGIANFYFFHSKINRTKSIVLSVIGSFIGGTLISLLGGFGFKLFNPFSLLLAIIGSSVFLLLGQNLMI
jgi:uncharacterized membrane protein YeaQ/YmgE (transglycosylase-associated protein family)